MSSEIDQQVFEELNAEFAKDPKDGITVQTADWRAVVQYLQSQPEKATPAARWREAGECDPHGDRFNQDRARLCMGHMTDDELANEVFLYNHRTGLGSLGYLTAAKERIRWLSRRLVEAQSGVQDPASKLAMVIHYPECWDTAAYPTLADAVWEICTGQGCSTCAETPVRHEDNDGTAVDGE